MEDAKWCHFDTFLKNMIRYRIGYAQWGMSFLCWMVFLAISRLLISYFTFVKSKQYTKAVITKLNTCFYFLHTLQYQVLSWLRSPPFISSHSTLHLWDMRDFFHQFNFPLNAITWIRHSVMIVCVSLIAINISIKGLQWNEQQLGIREACFWKWNWF